MKKMASICLFIVTILSFLVTINLYQSKDYEQVMKMGQTTNSFNFYIQNSDMTPMRKLVYLSICLINMMLHLF